MTARRHLWILLLALLLPLAQVAAAAHEVSHVSSALETGSKSGLHGGHCDLCALAAQVDGGAAPASPAMFVAPELRQPAPARPLGIEPRVGINTGFDSRAPPHTLLA